VTVEDITEHRFVNGSFNQDKYTVTVEYQAYTTTKNEGPNTVRQSPQFRLGKAYSFAGDRNNALKLTSVDVGLIDSNKRNLWLVSCTYETPDPGEDNDPNNPGGKKPPGDKNRPPKTVNPEIMEPPRLAVGFATYSKPMTRAKYLQVEQKQPKVKEPSYLYNKTLGGPGGNEYTGPVCNSLGIPVVPQPEREVMYPVFRLEGYLSIKVINEKKAWLFGVPAKINADPYVIKSPKTAKGEQFRMSCPPRTLRIENVQIGDIEAFHKHSLIRVSYEMAYNPEEWIHREFDESIAIKPSPDTYNDRVAANLNPELELMRDERGTPLPQPVPLDGKGEINRSLVSARGSAIKSTTPLSYFLTFLEDEDSLFLFNALPKLWED
jgi:hypothetical protein